MAHPKTVDALTHTHESQAIARAALTNGFSAARAGLRTMLTEVNEVRWDLAEIEDADDRNAGVVELDNKLGAFVREAQRLFEQMGKVGAIADEIERETPRIAGRLGIELGSDE